MANETDLAGLLTEKREDAIIVWLCNIGAEKYWNKTSSGIVDKREDEIAVKMEEISLLLCRPQDILILREKPDPVFLATLAGYGMPSPRIVCPEISDPGLPVTELALKDERLMALLTDTARSNAEVYFVPYAVTEMEEKLARRCGLSLIGPSSGICKWLNNKIHSREIAEKLGFPVCTGKVCRTTDEIREEYEVLTRQLSFSRVIVKEPFGASGKGLYVIDRQDMLEPVLTIVSRFAKKTGISEWLAEGWYEKKRDINYQIYISPAGDVKLLSVKEQILRGVVYVGSRMGADVIDADTLQKYSMFAAKLGDYLYNAGYTGIASIDSIMTGSGGIIPIIEINGRLSLSTYISFTDRLFRNRSIISMYYRLKADRAVEYAQIHGMLEKACLSFDVSKNEGIIVYSSATLPKASQADETGTFHGRMFVLIAAKTQDGAEKLKTEFETLMRPLFLSFA